MTFPKTQAVRLRDEVICDLLERLCRVRPLSGEESALLAKTMLRLGNKQANWRWTPEEDRIVREFVYRRIRNGGPPQPFVGNDEVRALAARLGRTYWATQRRMERLRKRAIVHRIAPRKLFKREDHDGGLESPAWTMNGHPTA